MNPEMMKSAIRSVLIGAACLMAGWLMSKGWITEAQWTALATGPVGGLLATAVSGMIWGMINKTEANAVAVVDAIAKQPDSPVKGVIMEPTAEGRDLAASIPGTTAVVAGTREASTIASR